MNTLQNTTRAVYRSHCDANLQLQCHSKRRAALMPLQVHVASNLRRVTRHHTLGQSGENMKRKAVMRVEVKSGAGGVGGCWSYPGARSAAAQCLGCSGGVGLQQTGKH